MKVTLKPISSIRPYETNPRTIGENSISAVASSIRDFGFRQPIVVDAEGVIIAGHTRYYAAQKLGLEKVPVHVATDLTAEQIRAYRIADNKTGELADWNLDLLTAELNGLQGAGFDLDSLGFDADELSKLIGGGTQGLTDPDDVPEPPAIPVCKPGDLWILGEHRLLCGDSTKAEDVARLMGGEKADLWLTDPPYGVAYESSGRRGKSNQHADIANDSMPLDDMADFWTSVAKNALDFCTDKSAYYWFACQGGDQMMMMMMMSISRADWKVRHELIWVKDSMVFGRCDYHYKHEPILYGWKSDGTHDWNSDRKQTSVLEYPRPKKSEEHPTMKPVELIEYLAGNNTKPGQIILDTFGGSGTTLIASEKSGRKSRLIEISPQYCDVIIARWENFTGRKAQLQKAKR